MKRKHLPGIPVSHLAVIGKKAIIGILKDASMPYGKIMVILTFVLLIGAVAFVPSSEEHAAGTAKIGSKNFSLNLGSVRTLTVSGASGNVKWSTSNKKIVSIKKNGNKATITAKKKRNATITARAGKTKLQ